MTEYALAAVLEKPGRFVLKEFPLPEVGENDGLLKVKLAGVCSSDVKRFRGEIAARKIYPIILGHEIVGEIYKLGERAAHRWGVNPGDRVVVENFVGCGFCSMCVKGYTRFCKDPRNYGTAIPATVPPYLWGGYSQFIYLSPNTQMYKLPDTVSSEAGVLINAVLANALRWVCYTGEIKAGDRIVIQVVFALGLYEVAMANEAGGRPVIALGRGRAAAGGKFVLAREYGADFCINVQAEDPVERVKEITGGRMAGIVVDLTGSPDGIPGALSLVGKRGTVVLASVIGDREAALFLDKVMFNEITIKGVFSHDAESLEKSIKMVEQNRYPFEKMVTHCFPLTKVNEALAIVSGEKSTDPACIKAVLDPWA